MKPILFNYTSGLTPQLDSDIGLFSLKTFPDGESCVRVESDCKDRDAIVLANLFQPDAQLLPLIFLAETLKNLGAKSVGLISPYLPYMRQDKSFNSGEGISAKYFGKLISTYFDSLITVDPHLHRIQSLDEVYTIKCAVLHAAPLVSDWIVKNVEMPLLIGPDGESDQWVLDVASRAHAPSIVLEKIRHGDKDVEVSVPDVHQWKNYTPVLVDDIISTGHTMLETIAHLKRAGMKPPVCVGVHGIFADGAYEKLLKSGASQIVTSNTIPHPSNQIDVFGLIQEVVMKILNPQ